MWANPQLTNEIINYVYYLGHLGCAFVFFRYTIAVLGIQEKRRVTLITSLPYAIANLEILLNPFFPFVFTIDENGFYARQSGVFFIYACAGYYLLCGFVVLLRYGSRMSIGKTYSLLTFVIMLFASTTVLLQETVTVTGLETLVTPTFERKVVLL